MSIIAVKGVPAKWSLQHMMKILPRAINGQFETLNFVPNKKVKTTKILYVRLSEKLDPLQIVERINRTSFSKATLFAYIPQDVPDMPLASNSKIIPATIRRALNIRLEFRPEQVLIMTHVEILREMQMKYTGLLNLSRRTDDKLLDEIAQTIFQRLKHIMETNADASETCFKLSKCYRKTHPHFGDFQLILSTLHRLQDAAGTPRSQLQESELASVDAQRTHGIPYIKTQTACTKYSERIVKKITEHINNLKSEINVETDSKEEIARKKVREELKKLNPYLSTIVKQIVSKHLLPPQHVRQKMRIYGEPFIPPKEQIRQWLRPAPRVIVRRSDRAFNMMIVIAPPERVAALKAMDGSVVNGAKLIIRSANVPLYKPRNSLIAKMKAMFGVEHKEEDKVMYEEEAEEATEKETEDEEEAVDEEDPEHWAQWV